MTELQRKQRASLVFLLFFISLIFLVDPARSSNNVEDEGGKDSRSNATRFSRVEEAFEKNEGKSSVENSGTITRDDNVTLNGDGDGDEDEEDTEDEEYEGEDEAGDEYAEELRAAAESHEAMSRNDKQNEKQSESYHVAYGGYDLSDNSKISNIETAVATKKDFDSKEKSVEETSDENESSNETFVDGAEQEDEEVTELIKYKNTNHFRKGDDTVKKKREPTVKKELSTQTEIKTLNDSKTRIDKRFSTKEMLDELNKQFKHSTGYTEKSPNDESTPQLNESSVRNEEVIEESEAEPDDYLDKKLSPVSDKQQDIDSKSSNSDSEDIEGSRKLDKRQEAVLKDLETYLRAEYAAEQEQQQKLEELGAQEGALAESLLELLVKLAENPRRWERVHRLLMDVEGGLELSRQALEARKRSFNLTSMGGTTTTTTTTSPLSTTTTKKQRKKPKKKKKKKKKKQRHHRFSTTTTTIPTTIPLITTTEAPWLTTPMQWRLVAERLFGPPWPQDLQDDPGLPKVRFTVPSNSRTPASAASREFVDQLTDQKQLDEHKALNNERQALMLESSREYTQPRHLHYGKVNTHRGVNSHSAVVPANRDNSRVRDYDPPEIRYGSFDYPRARGLKNDDFYPVESYAQNREYRPPGREYAASKSWHDSQYNYGIPNWKYEDSSSKWSWPQLDETKGSWQRDNYWPPTRIRDQDDAKVWQNSPDNWEKDSSWGKSSSPWLSQDNIREKGLNPPWLNQNNKNDVLNSNLSKVQIKDTAKIIKMKGSWNDQSKDRSWPFKSKEQNDLDQLGLQNDSKYKTSSNPIKIKSQNSWGNEMNENAKIWPQKTAMSPKIQSVGAWVMPVDQSTWKPYNLKSVDTGEGGGESNRHRWNVEMDTNPRTWPPKIGEQQWNKFGKPGNGVGWPKWKQFAYHRVTAMPILNNAGGGGGGGSSLGDGSRVRNNAYIAVSAVSPKYNGNQWRKNDIEETPVVPSNQALRTNANGGDSASLPTGLQLQDPEHPVSQLRGNNEKERPIYTWKKKDASSKDGLSPNNPNGTDPLEEQLETLRRGATWSHNENRDNIKKQLNVISDASETLASRLKSSDSSLNKSTELLSISIIDNDSNKNNVKNNVNGENIDQNKNEKVERK